MKLKNTTLEWTETSKALPMEHEAITFWRKVEHDFVGITIGCGMYEKGLFHDMFSMKIDNTYDLLPAQDVICWSYYANEVPFDIKEWRKHDSGKNEQI